MKNGENKMITVGIDVDGVLRDFCHGLEAVVKEILERLSLSYNKSIGTHTQKKLWGNHLHSMRMLDK